jgi:hypothetical protein
MALLSASHQLRQASRCLYASLVRVIFRPVDGLRRISITIIDVFYGRYHVDEKHSSNECEYASHSAETHSHSKPRQLKST